jgi:ubiquinone/menaquinone biosynthesis C-methylase UbiE
MLDLNPQITLLEVGCAAGFLAQGVSPKVLKYMGVDLSPVSLKLARRLDLPNAVFRPANATVLPFGDSHFDRALCYDVFTNISDLEVCKKIIAEMARVVKPDGCFLIGSLADARAQVGYEQKVSELSASLPPFMDDPDIVSKKWMPWQYRLLTMWHKARKHQPSQIFCYYFDPDLFVGIGKDLGLKVEILPIHSRNPYASYRFNVLFLK